MGLFGRFARTKPDKDEDHMQGDDRDDADAGRKGLVAGSDDKDDDNGSDGTLADTPRKDVAAEKRADMQSQSKDSGEMAGGNLDATRGDAAGKDTSAAATAGTAGFSADKSTNAVTTDSDAGKDGAVVDDGSSSSSSSSSTSRGPSDAGAGADNMAEHAQDAGTSDATIQQKRLELNDIQKRIKNVKDEYGESVKRLMDTKKDLNEKRLEIEAAEKKLTKIQESIDAAAEIDTQTRKKIDRQEAELEKLRDETRGAQESYDELLEGISQEQHALSALRTQHSEVSQQLEETNARLYNAREELDRQDTFQGPDSLTRGEREFIEGGDAAGKIQKLPAEAGQDGTATGITGPRSYAGVVEAASVVVASLKSKLGMTQKELEAAQRMLDQERAQHAETRRQLDDALSQQQQKPQPPQDAAPSAD